MNGDPVIDAAEAGAPAGAPAHRRIELEAVPDNVARLRHEARTFAVLHGASATVAGDVALAVSEAATNAVLHAFVDRVPGSVTLVCEAGRDRLRLRVIDDGSGMQPRPDSPGMGIGLSTIGKVASGMTVAPGERGEGTEVAMVFDAPGVRGPLAAPTDPAEAALLDAASRLAQTAVWPQEGVERLADLLVGRLADAVTVDLVDDGVLRRLSARVAGDDELSRWLAASLPPLKPGTATWQVAQGDAPAALVVHDPTQARPAHGPGERLGLQWWLACSLPDRAGRPLGILGLGGRGTVPAPDDRTVGLCAEIAERAAGGLAQARVTEGLVATRRRLEGILGALGEAVTLSSAEGSILWANEAAARMLDAASVEELIATAPGEVAARYAMTGEDGAPLDAARLPSRRLLAGLDAPPVVLRSVERRTGRARWMRVTATLLDDGDGPPLAVNIFADVTAERRAQLRRAALEEAGRLLDVADPADPAVLQAVCEAVAPVKADRCAIDLLGPDGALRRVAACPVGTAPPAVAPELADAVLATGQARIGAAAAGGRRAVLHAPLRGGGAVLGLVTLAHAESERGFDDGDLAFAADLGRRVGAAVALVHARARH